MISRRGFLTVPLSAAALAQTPPIYDVLLKNGHVLDFRNKRNGRFDIALVKDKIVRVAQDLPPAHARLVLDVGDYYVTPGLIDIHTHFDAGGADLSLQPDHHALPNGVTTAVDAGGSGHRNFEAFKSRTIDHSKTRILAWLNIVGAFRVSLPALDHFPISVWSRLVARHSRRPVRGIMAYSGPMGHLPLREAIAEYLGAFRAVRCEASQIMVTTGSQQGLQLSAQVLLDPQDRVWIEEPGYPSARQAFIAAGAHLIPVPVDHDGMNIQEIIRRNDNARAVYITPSHQYPLGMTMSATRRMLLLNWAVRTGAWIIEDDYDSEYRFGGRPIASLQGLDTDGRVIYVGTFSKVMFPAMRLGYLVLPKDLVPAFAVAREATDTCSASLYQSVMADFIREGHFARHIARMRKLYAQRRRALVEAIQQQLSGKLEVLGAEAGMQLAVLLPRGVDDVTVARRAAKKGVSARPLSACYLNARARGGLILGYGGTDTAAIHEGVQILGTCI